METSCQTFSDMEFESLYSAQEGPELNPTFFDEGNYTPIEEILAFVESRTQVVDVKSLLPQLSLNGRVLEEDMDIYLRSKGCSSSSLKEALKSPLHYLISTEEKEIRQDKSHFNLGTFCHTAFLEPEKFDALAVEPEGGALNSVDGAKILVNFWEDQAANISNDILITAYARTIDSGLSMDKLAGLKFYVTELRKLCGKISVDKTSYAIVKLIKKNYYRYGDGIIPELLKGAVPELSMYGTDEETGLPVKMRPDSLQIEENIGCNAIISFKTTSADSVSKMQYDAAKYMYHLSEGMYSEVAESITGRKFTAVICIMLQTVIPYLPVVFLYSPEDIANGKYRYRTALRNVKQAMAKNYWPGFDVHAEEGHRGVINMNLPEWSLREELPQTIDV